MSVVLALMSACGHKRPTVRQAERGAREFSEALPFSQNVVDTRVADVLKAAAARPPASPSKEPGATNPMVHQFGRQLVDGRGEPLRLVGVNLGGAYLWEAWIWGGEILRLSRNTETTIRTGLTDLLGASATSAFATQVYDRYITAEDFAAIAGMGFNTVRVPLNHRLFADGRGFAILDRLLGWAEASRVYVVLDLHSAPGGQSASFPADPEPPLLWQSADRKDRTIALWRAIAARYASRTIVAGYDLLNEPEPPRGEDLVVMYRDIIKAIRDVDRQHLIILEGSDSARDFSMFSGPIDPNSAYSFHMYTWFGEQPEALVAKYAAVAQRHNLPLLCGEFGENQPASIRASLDAIDRPANATAGWSFWTWKKAIPARYPALVGVRTTPDWTSVIQWISAP